MRAVRSLLDENGPNRVRKVLGDRERVPGINVAVHKEYVCGSSGCDVLTAVVAIGEIDAGRIESDSECVVAHLFVVLERYQVAKRLVGRVGGLKVAKLHAGLVDPLAAAIARHGGVLQVGELIGVRRIEARAVLEEVGDVDVGGEGIARASNHPVAQNRSIHRRLRETENH